MNDLPDARCADGSSHDLFFSEHPSDLAAAQALCMDCAVRRPCLERALALGCDWGVWGGVVFIDGRPFHRKRGRGRPSRNDLQRPLEVEDIADLLRSA
ncbi:MAG TPA: WhiB family transcriptional regulator [Acidimicrobiia bacterium]|jgi:WhiB family redox-sensing transcriptional regulator